jgi:hypothetical protein
VADDHGLSQRMRLYGAAAGEQLKDENDQREDEKDVDERADRGERDDAEQPEDEQHDDNGPEHACTSLRATPIRKVHAIGESDRTGACRAPGR